MNYKTVTHVIFDLDGLLIESESVYDRILSEITLQFDTIYSNDIRLKIMGATEQDTAKIVVKELQLPLTTEEFLKIYRAKAANYLTHPALMPGARLLIQHLSDNNIPIAVATSSSKEEMQIKTKYHQDLFQLFHHIVCGTSDPEVKLGKPAPDIFLICASRFEDRPDPSKCIVLEDSPNGIVAARKAGMQAVMVPEDHVSEELRKPATVVLKSLKEFQPEWFGLPSLNQ